MQTKTTHQTKIYWMAPNQNNDQIAKNKTQQTEEMAKVPSITQEMTYQANLDILYQPIHKENRWS